ncbi:hypothetical protein [Hymenobacter sp. AT01-02]|uniref:hypothetical protein n=1 Tax=Hymenobacter sp. AT01-02 TaxID=1571877 RepID=UPI000A9160BD|nr:hypothetical protein [Hymenobacter sp. AT01-02]
MNSYFVSQPNHSNSQDFEQRMLDNAEHLGAQFRIRQISFDSECIYAKEDLTALVLQFVRDLGQFPAVCVEDGLDTRTQEYFTRLYIRGQQYEFRTSAEGDYVNLDKVMPMLQTIAREQQPTHTFEIIHPPYDQTGIVIFAALTDLQEAVDRGYPCSLPSSHWVWQKHEWPWGVYSDVTVDHMPELSELQTRYYQTLHQLYTAGYNVPQLTAERIYLTDMFEQGKIDICIDGSNHTSFNDVLTGGKVRCFWEGWGVVLAYTLVQHYGGQPALYNKTSRQVTRLTPSAYLRQAEVAFGRRPATTH